MASDLTSWGAPALFLLVFVAWACGPGEPGGPAADPAEQYAYFPLAIGKSVTYTVDSIRYDPAPDGNIRRDSVRVFLRETITDTLRGNGGQLLFVVERQERRADTAAWALKNVWSAVRTTTQAIRTEDNLRFLRLVFPFDSRTAWDGNVWIDPDQEIEIAGETLRPFANWLYRVDSLDLPGTVGAFVFDSLLVVTETDEDNLFERRLSRAKYAKNVGLVWREQWIMDSQYCNRVPTPPDCATKPWPEKAEKGFIVRQVMLDFN